MQYLRIIDKKSEVVERELHKSQKNRELIELLELEKSLVYFTTSLRSNEVVFEKLLMTENEEEVAEHEDLEDQNQTVRLLKQPGTPGKVRTGDGSLGKIWIFMILVAACGMAAVQTAEKRTRRW